MADIDVLKLLNMYTEAAQIAKAKNNRTSFIPSECLDYHYYFSPQKYK